MGKIAAILKPACIKIELAARKKEEAIEELVALLADAGEIDNAPEVIEAVIARERMVTTGVGDGVAIPHARISEIENTVMAFGKKKRGLPFNALDGRPVQLVFLLISPKAREAEQLILLSTLARLIRSRSVRKALLSARTPEQVISTLQGEETRGAAR